MPSAILNAISVRKQLFTYSLGWPKSLFRFFNKILCKTQMNFLANSILSNQQTKAFLSKITQKMKPVLKLDTLILYWGNLISWADVIHNWFISVPSFLPLITCCSELWGCISFELSLVYDVCCCLVHKEDLMMYSYLVNLWLKVSC